MICGVIMAGGTGTRMGNVGRPKQFLDIGGKPIIIHTLEKFLCNDRFDRILVLCPEDWTDHAEKLIEKYCSEFSCRNKVSVIEGGKMRNDTIMNAIAYIEKTDGLDENTIFVTHDAARPFVTQRIIDENIDTVEAGYTCDTAVPATDTLAESHDGMIVDRIPDRAEFFNIQTPQSFRAEKFRELYSSLSEDEKNVLTDASKVFVVKGETVKIVRGEFFNFKITYPHDIRLAESMLQSGMI